MSSGRREADITNNNVKTESNRQLVSIVIMEQRRLFKQYDTKLKQNLQMKKKITDMETQYDWYGDKMSFNEGWDSGRDINTFRVATLNINGISKNLDWLEWEILLDKSKNLQLDCIGITEPNINFNNNKVMLALYEKMKALDRHMQITVSCSNQLNSVEKKRGGTATVLNGKWAGRKVHAGKDNKGRWSTLTIKGKQGRKITIITAYRVCKQKGGVGSTIYHQQQLDFDEVGKRHIDLRKKFCLDMITYVRRLHEEHHTVILMGDFNEDLNIKGGQMDNMLRDCQLVNVFHTVYGRSACLPPTYDRGQKCIDMIAITDSPRVPKSCIRRAGFMPFYHHFCSDHRLIYCDIDTSVLFGSFQPDLTKISMRPFTTNNIKKCNRFKEKLRELYTTANIFTIVESLDKRFKSAKGKELNDVIKDCIKYNTTAGQLMISAGKRTGSRAYRHGKPFSDKLSNAARKFHTQKNLLRFLTLQRKQSLSSQEEEDLIRQIKDAYKELRQIQSESIKIREQFLNKLADKRATEWNLSSTAALHTIMQAESSKRTFARHGRVMKGSEKGSIKELVIPVPKHSSTKESTDKAGWETITDEETIFSLLLQRNTQQLLRSANCPFAYGKITDECGMDGNGVIMRDILNGTLSDMEHTNLIKEYDDPKPELMAFMKALARPKEEDGRVLQDFEWDFGIKEYRATFRKTRESTSCGPSGLNMSFWKACAEDDDLARVQAFFIEKAFRYGFSYPRWQVSWHCMLQKLKTPYIHKLRIIQLFEGDFNGALKYLLGRLLMYHVVNQRKCDKQAFGSIPGRTAHDALITLQLIYDNARLNKSVLASMFNDAAGCYDRIRPLLSSICMQRVGCPESISLCHTITQRKMIHKVKTSAGVSPGTISWGPFQKMKTMCNNGVYSFQGNIGGIGQGGGGSPIGWLSVLLVMIITYSQFASGVTMSDPLGSIVLVIYIISYVDDNTLVQGFNRDQSMSSILEGLNRCITKWHTILCITGGDLALEKCSYCVMKWKWKNGIATLETPSSSPGDLFVSGTKIQRLKPNEGTRVLGVRMAMDGSFGDELKYRIGQSKTMASKLYSSRLSAIDSFMVYETRYKPALEYPLPVTTFTTKELQQIQKPFIHLLLPKLGLNRHTPRAIIYGPQFRGGLGILNLEEEQVTQHFRVLQGHIRRNDDIGKSLRIQLSTQQVEVGCGELFLNTNPLTYNYSNQETRLSYLWQQCNRYNIQVTINDVWIPNRGEECHDTIMDFAVKDERLKGNYSKLRSINACRLYLKVMWPSDLVSSQETDILNKQIIQGKQPSAHPKLQYPYQERPSLRCLTLWKEFIYRTFCLARKDTKGGLIYKLATPVLSGHMNHNCATDYDEIILSIRGITTLQDKFSALPAQFRDIIGKINIPIDEGMELIHAIKHDHTNVRLASDGSYLQHLNIGSHAYKILHKDNETAAFTGAAMSPQSDCMSSSPTEHYGAIAILTVLIVLLEHHGLTDRKLPSLTLLIDNKEVVERGSSLNPEFMNIKEYLTHDYDLWCVLSNLQLNLKTTIHFEWIKGHQSSTDDEPAKEAIQINNDVDKLASEMYTYNLTPSHRRAYHAGIVCFHQNGYHIQDIFKAVSSHESDKDLIDYYISKGWTMSALERVDWPGMKKFLHSLSPITRCNAIQMLHDWQNTGYQKGQFYNSSSGDTGETQSASARNRITACPMGCGHLELPFHFMTCKCDKMNEARRKGLATIKRALRKLRTAPSLIEAIIEGIFCFCDQTEFELTSESDPLLFDLNHSVLLSNQGDIGWDFFVKGFISKDWRYIQHSYYQYLKLDNRKFNAEKWVQRLLRTLHKFRTDLWQLRNSALHGGYSDSHGSALRARLCREVHSLYKRDRSRLSLADRQLFHLPKIYRLRQGNQHLLLWTKRAHMTFDIYEENIDGLQQTFITDWLSSWQSPLTCPPRSTPNTATANDDGISLSHSDARLLLFPPMGCKETNKKHHNNLINDNATNSDNENDSFNSCKQMTQVQTNTKVIKGTNMVADGTSQRVTPIRSSC